MVECYRNATLYTNMKLFINTKYQHITIINKGMINVELKSLIYCMN